MILRSLTDQDERREAQRQLIDQLKGALASKGIENIGYPGGNTNTEVYVERETGLWFAQEDQPKARVPRYWNAFGFYREGRNQQITVEINIPINRLTGQVAGAFARDERTGDTYLLHSGKVGGGTQGVGKAAFLVWSSGQLEWCDVGGTLKSDDLPYIVIGKLGAADLASRIARFTRVVSNFKIAVRAGELSKPSFQQRIHDHEKYLKEFSGRKRGERKSAFDYFSYHGDVVDALRSRLISAGRSERDVVNSPLIDLYVKSGSAVVAVYEVKTQIDRGNIYTAIGQLMVHTPEGAQRTLVLPEHERLPDDIRACLSLLSIDLLQFRLEGRKRKTVILS